MKPHRFVVQDRITGESLEFANLIEASFCIACIRVLGGHPAELRDTVKETVTFFDSDPYIPV